MAQTINVSTGTAAVLGLARIEMDTAPTTAYLMLGGRCRLACAFCTQARDSTASALHLSRITWPEHDQAETVARLQEAVARGDVKRACLQVTAGRDYYRRALDVLRAIGAASDVPVDVSILPRDIRQVEDLVAAGADHVGFGLDAASKEVFRRVKGGHWTRHLRLVEEAARLFPGRVAVHLIGGLGETEREMVEMIQRLHDQGVTVGLFAFTPVRGTAMEDASPPPLAVYRRMQVARHLIAHNLARAEAFAFSNTGQLIAFNVPHLRALLAGGAAFQTSGCPDCNRPFYNERPGGTMYNYPRSLTADEAKRAWAEMWIGKTNERRVTNNKVRGAIIAPTYPPATWRLLDTGQADGATNMAVDEAILRSVARGEAEPTIRFFGWQPPCLSIGYAQPMDGDVDVALCAARGVDCVRRPTGGRAILHTDELTYSLVAPTADPRITGDVLETYRRLSAGLVLGLRALGVAADQSPGAPATDRETSPACFEAPSRCEITFAGRKLVGSAQMRTREAVLQHGSLPLLGDVARISNYLRVSSDAERAALRRELRMGAISLEEALGRALPFDQTAQALADGFARALNLRLIPGELSTAEQAEVERLRREKYVNREWNYRQ